MKKYVITFLHRGLIFGGLGPIITSIVFFILSKTLNNFSITASQALLATVSSYILAFVQAGSSIFNTIEHWSTGKTLLLHFSTLYITYISCYMINSWIPLIPIVIVIFTIVFAISYIVIWLAVYLSVRVASKKFNSRLKS